MDAQGTSRLGVDVCAWDELFRQAVAASEHSYSPYSGHKVGAALLTVTGELFSGCNVEMKPSGLTICAEHNAISTAVCALGPSLRIQKVAVFSARTGMIMPCGACRQVISEFGPGAIVGSKHEGKYLLFPIEHLLPDAYR